MDKKVIYMAGVVDERTCNPEILEVLAELVNAHYCGKSRPLPDTWKRALQIVAERGMATGLAEVYAADIAPYHP